MKNISTNTKKDISIQIQEGLSDKANNYNKELYRLIKPYCGKKILEVGCSIGNITRLLLNKNTHVTGIDVVPQAIRIIKKNFSRENDKNWKNFDAHVMDASDSAILRLAKGRDGEFDTVVCMNVLEHIQKDQKALDNFYELLMTGGKLVLIVPAHQFLYGSVDKSDHHFRRYTKSSLRPKISKSGFRMIKMHYINLPGMLGWYVNGKILKKKMVDSSMLGFYDSMIPFVFRMERAVHPPIGLSILCICEKD